MCEGAPYYGMITHHNYIINYL